MRKRKKSKFKKIIMSDEKTEQFMKELDTKISRVLGILEDDPKIGEKGLVQRVRSTETKLDEIIQRDKIFKAKASVWGVIGGSFMTILLWLGKLLIAKFIN